ncbi:mechanosensitive ion channel family protein [Luteithermobacter gelatinilyticus]|uniref:mechanosensitive ion channel family protein n=1 Tax=Luteithermobacter gelatinilyticus TaxID=2582913 RepID=UPI00110741AC|nr:mechanosensitive ion channel domain-containing protein [Luteithermobacter gelatinilyticus]
MEELFIKGQEILDSLVLWMDERVLTYTILAQLGIVLFLWLTSTGIVFWLKPLVKKLWGDKIIYQKLEARYLNPLYLPIFWLLLLQIAQAVMRVQAYPDDVVRIAISLLSAWIVIRLATNLIRNREIARLVRVFVWLLVALNIVGWLEPVMAVLENTRFSLGGAEVSVLGIITGMITLLVLIWIGVFLSGLMENWLRKVPTVTPSARVLLGKLTKILLVSIAFLVALSSMGIDLTALAVFGGAIGVGLGFGLQKVVSNFISGVILLLDRSIKPGDVIEVSGTYGRIDKLAARYTSVISRDGREFLVPNEDMITQPVINWTYTNSEVRRHLPVGVSYASDLDRAMELMLEAAHEVPRVLKMPAPTVQVKGFGDSSIDLELRIWIRDSEQGVSNVASDVNYLIWKKFSEDPKVEMPFPQRDIHIVSAQGLKDQVQDAIREAMHNGDKDQPNRAGE